MSSGGSCARSRRSSTPRHGADDEERLPTRRDRIRQVGIRQLVGQVLLAREEAHEGAAALGEVVTNRPAQHRVAGLERVEDGALRDGALDFDLDLAVDARELPEVCREHDPDHRRVCTSTESTAGRSRTIGAQVSPASADAYTWPPVVPK